MSYPKLRRFQILYNGLRLGVPETANVDLTRERLGFFQVFWPVPQGKEKESYFQLLSPAYSA